MQTAASGLPPPRVPGGGKRPSGGHIGAPPEGGHFRRYGLCYTLSMMRQRAYYFLKIEIGDLL